MLAGKQLAGVAVRNRPVLEGRPLVLKVSENKRLAFKISIPGTIGGGAP